MSAIPPSPPPPTAAALPPSETELDRRPSVPPSEGFSADSERTVADTPELDEKKLRLSSDELSDVPEKPRPSPSPTHSHSHSVSQLSRGAPNARTSNTHAALPANSAPAESNASHASHADSTIGKNEGKKGWRIGKKDGKKHKESKKDDVEAQRAPDIYDRFPPRKKKLIVAIVAYSAFLGRKLV